MGSVVWASAGRAVARARERMMRGSMGPLFFCVSFGFRSREDCTMCGELQFVFEETTFARLRPFRCKKL